MGFRFFYFRNPVARFVRCLIVNILKLPSPALLFQMQAGSGSFSP